jgi:hypothetical protein
VPVAQPPCVALPRSNLVNRPGTRPVKLHARHGDELPLEIERLWSTLAMNRRNIIPVMDFLATLGTHMACQVRARGRAASHSAGAVLSLFPLC